MDVEALRDLGRRAANHTGYRQILVLGSQAVHGALPDVALPEIVVASNEADLAVVTDLAGDAAHAIEAQFGVGSPYHQHFGVYADGISLSEVTLPDGWQGRLRKEHIHDDGDPENPVTLLFPEIHDLCASKLTVAITGGFGRRADRAFVQALVTAGHVSPEVLDARAARLPDTVPRQVRQAVHRLVAGLQS